MSDSVTKSECLLSKEQQFSAHNYIPMPIVFKTAKGCDVWDVDDKHYLDFGSGYCSTNQGHCHPKIINALKEQAEKLTMPSRAFSHELFGDYMEFVCQYFGYEKGLPLNGGSEAIEFVIKLARAWGYTKKGIKPDKAKVLFAEANYHGRTLGSVSASTNPSARKNYGPFIPNVGPNYGDNKVLRFNYIEDVEEAFELEGENICAIVLETMQGQGGIIPPDPNYLPKVKELCKKYNVLYAADEIHAGCGRTGKLLACEHYGVVPDILAVAKSIGGGVFPTSLVLSSAEIMDTIEPGSHGATFSGSPLSCATSKVALQVLKEENMAQNAAELGQYLFDKLNTIKSQTGMINEIRGKGFFVGIDLNQAKLDDKLPWHVCMLLRSKGIICNLVHTTVIKWAPPLMITKEQLDFALRCLEETLVEIPCMSIASIPEAEKYSYLRV